MVTSEERIKILKMVDDGKITAEEAAKLLKALGKQQRRRPGFSEGGARWLRIRITDFDSGKSSVNVTLPLNMVNVGLKMGARFLPELEGLDLAELAEALREGTTGKIVDVIDEEDRQHVEVYIE